MKPLLTALILLMPWTALCDGNWNIPPLSAYNGGTVTNLTLANMNYIGTLLLPATTNLYPGIQYFSRNLMFTNSTGGSPSVIGQYYYAGLLGGVSSNGYFTNANATMAMVSNIFFNGSAWKNAFTNAGTVYYRAGVNNANVWTAVSGSAPVPTPVFSFDAATNDASPQNALFSSFPIINPESASNTYVTVETFGNDATGLTGITPYATLNLAANAPNVGNMGIGVGMFYLTGNAITLTNFSNIYGYSSELSAVNDGQTNALRTSFIINSGTTLDRLKILAVVGAPASTPITNVVINECTIGDAAQVEEDNIYQTTGSGTALIFNLTVNRSKFITAWDSTVGVGQGAIYNDTWIYGIGNTADLNGSTTGLHGFTIGLGLSGDNVVSATINGGGVVITNAYTSLISQSTSSNYCIGILSSNATVQLNGPSLWYPTNCIDIFNWHNCTNINGYYFANGVYTTVANGVFTRFPPTGLVLNPAISGGFYTNTNGCNGTFTINHTPANLTDSLLMSNITTLDAFIATNSVAPGRDIFRMAVGEVIEVTNLHGSPIINSSSFRP